MSTLEEIRETLETRTQEPNRLTAIRRQMSYKLKPNDLRKDKMLGSHRHTVDIDRDNLFYCSSCESIDTHQKSVDVFFREEDSDTGVATHVDDNGTTSTSDQTDNPSPRRDGIVITLECEYCPVITKVNIVQHKGGTYIYNTNNTNQVLGYE
tara:strand:- start:44 stop:499 length:456 start_codon:yes stop_codon:yes gene_type:complete